MAVAYSYLGKKPKVRAMFPAKAPELLYGTGVPDGDAEPFVGAAKGSLYMQQDATDDTCPVWCKLDEGNDDDDWSLLALPA